MCILTEEPKRAKQNFNLFKILINMKLELFNKTALTDEQLTLLGDGIDVWESTEITPTVEVCRWVAVHGSAHVLFESTGSICAEDNEWRVHGTIAWLLTAKKVN